MKLDSVSFIWLAVTVYHEARGESPNGQRAVAKVILNRADRKSKSIEETVTANKQFSCYNSGLASSSVWIKELLSFVTVAYNVGVAIEEWNNGDTLNGANHYYAPSGVVGGKPGWADKMTQICAIGKHVFLREG